VGETAVVGGDGSGGCHGGGGFAEGEASGEEADVRGKGKGVAGGSVEVVRGPDDGDVIES
jgi:hypothetical protein